MPTVDLNCDVGEGVGVDDELMPHVTSANIACGFHAGNPATMRRTVALALRHNVALGAHPGFNDLPGFGRRNIELSVEEVSDLVVYQVGALAAFAAAEGGRLSHVKPHGALYNMAVTRRELAGAIATAVRSVDPTLVLFALSASELAAAGRAAGLTVAEEGFVDRRYAADGTLVSRSQSGAVITDARVAIAQGLRMVREGTVRSVTDTDVRVRADTICIHGDTPGAPDFARQLRAALESEGVRIAALRSDVGAG
jgi:UPF0271 protein